MNTNVGALLGGVLCVTVFLVAQESSDIAPTKIMNDATKPQALQLPALQSAPTAPAALAVDAPDASTKAPETPAVSADDAKKDGSTEEVLDPLDTIDIEEGGNWLLVRKALEDTVDAIEDINKVFTAILDIRMEYLKKRNKADSDFDTFLNGIGFELGDVDRLLTQLIERLEQERVEDGALTEQEREMLRAAQEKKEEIKGLREDIKVIMDFDHRIDDVIMTVEQQVNTCRDYQSQAWKNFQKIKRVYDDEKAESLYQQTEALLANMKEIQSYLKGSLSQYFDETTANMNSSIVKFQSTVNKLKTEGVDLKSTVFASVTGDDEQQLKDKIDAAVAQQRKLDQSPSWFNQVVSFFSLGYQSLVKQVGNAYQWIASKIGLGSPKTAPVAIESKDATPVAATNSKVSVFDNGSTGSSPWVKS